MAVRGRSGGPSHAMRIALATGALALAWCAVLVFWLESGGRRELRPAGAVPGLRAVAGALAAVGADGFARIEEGVWHPRPGARGRLEGLVRAVPELVNVRVLDPRGRPVVALFAVDAFENPRRAGGFGDLAAAWGDYRSGAYRRRLLRLRAPLATRAGSAGTVEVYARPAAPAGSGGGGRAALALLLSALVLGGAAAGIGAVASRPLRALVEQVRKVHRGNLRFRGPEERGDEVGALARALAGLVEDLREGQEAAERLSLREHEARILVELQDALSPKTPPSVEGFEIDVMHVAGVQGTADFHDMIPLPGGKLALLVASTSGHGALGALLAATTRAHLRAYLDAGVEAGRALARTNRSLASGFTGGHHVTLQLAVLDPAHSRATVHVAGHRAPLLVCRAGGVEAVHGEGLALGLDEGAVFEDRLEELAIEMPPGTRLVLCTPGAYEIADERGRVFGLEAFVELVRRHAPKNSGAFVHLVFGALDAHLGGAERPADATLLTVKRTV